MRSASGTAASRSAMPRWIATAQVTAWTALGNSQRMPSPISLTTRPPCSATSGSTSSLRWALRRVEGALLVALHEARVADHVRRQDGGEPALRTGHGRALRRSLRVTYQQWTHRARRALGPRLGPTGSSPIASIPPPGPVSGLSVPPARTTLFYGGRGRVRPHRVVAFSARTAGCPTVKFARFPSGSRFQGRFARTRRYHRRGWG